MQVFAIKFNVRHMCSDDEDARDSEGGCSSGEGAADSASSDTAARDQGSDGAGAR